MAGRRRLCRLLLLVSRDLGLRLKGLVKGKNSLENNSDRAPGSFCDVPVSVYLIPLSLSLSL
jgi:hypothetical protein